MFTTSDHNLTNLLNLFGYRWLLEFVDSRRHEPSAVDLEVSPTNYASIELVVPALCSDSKLRINYPHIISFAWQLSSNVPVPIRKQLSI